MVEVIGPDKAKELWRKGWVSRSQIISWQLQGFITQQDCDEILSSPGGH